MTQIDGRPTPLQRAWVDAWRALDLPELEWHPGAPFAELVELYERAWSRS